MIMFSFFRTRPGTPRAPRAPSCRRSSDAPIDMSARLRAAHRPLTTPSRWRLGSTMPYAEGRTIHDADSHVIETPDWLVPGADPAVRERMPPLYRSRVKPGEETFIDELRRRHEDPAERPQAEAEIMLRKNWGALGSFVKEDRPRALDLLGFASQLVFNTLLRQYLCQTEHEPHL